MLLKWLGSQMLGQNRKIYQTLRQNNTALIIGPELVYTLVKDTMTALHYWPDDQ